MYEVTEHKFVGQQELEIGFTHIRNSGGSNSVSFVFPGAGYTVDKPLLHYSTMLMLQHGIDVVHVRYKYYDYEEFRVLSREEQSEWMYRDVNQVVDRVLSESDYDHSIFIGKSIGTLPIINGFVKEGDFKSSPVVLLTPLLNSRTLFNNLMECEQSTLLVIGDHDRYFKNAYASAIRKQKSNIDVMVVEKANHGLEIGVDVNRSVDVLSDVMNRIRHFIRQNLTGQ